ncbi:MAG: hypothetical protein QM713_17665 [Arachnia sp.]
MADAALKVAGAARAAAPTLKVSIDDRTAEQFEAVKAVVERIKLAKIAGDGTVLQEIAANLSDSSDFSIEENAYLAKMVAEAAESSRGGETEAVDPAIEALDLLQSEGRDSNRNAVRANVAAGNWQVVWGVELNEGEYAKFIASVAASVVTARPGLDSGLLPGLSHSVLCQVQGETPGDCPECLHRSRDRGQSDEDPRQDLQHREGRHQGGGIATYNNWQMVSYNEPRTRMVDKCKTVLGKKICVKVPEVYTVKVTKKVPLPNKHQPYFAFRLY